MDSSDHLERIYPHDGWCILILLPIQRISSRGGHFMCIELKLFDGNIISLQCKCSRLTNLIKDTFALNNRRFVLSVGAHDWILGKLVIPC